MTIKFNLEKSTQALSFELKKHNVDKIVPCQVHIAMDTSGSFRDEHQAGYTQQLLNRFVPFSMLFDKDKVLDSVSFACNAYELPEITEKNFSNYIQKHVPYQRGGGTDYAKAFEVMLASTKNTPKTQQVTREVTKAASGFLGKLFGKKVTETVVDTVATPTSYTEDKHLFFFVTDGEPNSETEAARVLDSLMKDNVFIVFLSISNRPVRFLDRFAKEPYASYINFTPSELRNLENVTDEELYGKLLASPQLVAWMNK